MGDMTKSQAASAIGYCSNYLKNFTSDESNRWNKIRNELFVPIAILLLLPGAVLTQVRAMAVAGNPVLSDPTKGDVNPFEGILRSVVAVFLIPATYLVINYGIDFSNSIVDSIAGTYQNIMGSNMYQDALGTEVNAFPVRTPKENQNSGTPAEWPSKAITNIKDFEETYILNKDANGNAPKNKTDEAMPAGAVAARQMSYGANAGLTAAWNILCAFQMAYLGYLFFVGPIAAALWVWPMANFRAAFPNWVEGVITLCFWSLFWNTAILLMACFKGADESSTMITSALNFLATASVKFAFDFASLVKAAGQQAGTQAMDAANGKGGGGGGKGSQGKTGASASNPKAAAVAAGANVPVGASRQLASDSQSASAPGSSTDLSSLTTTPEATPAANFRSNGSEPANSGASNSAGNSSDLQLPPLAMASRSERDSIKSQSTALGNFTVSRGLDENGQLTDVLRTANGDAIAHLPVDSSDNSVAEQSGLTIERNTTDAGISYSLTNPDGQTVSALMPASNQPTQAAAMGGTLNGTGNLQGDSLALRSTAGTLLLENGGNTVLFPCSDSNGYDSYTLQPGSTEGNFVLPDGRALAISQNQDGSRQVAMNAENGQSESFTIRLAADGAYNIAHSVNGQSLGISFVSTDGSSTYYSKYDAAGNLTDIDQISGNQIISTLYGDEASILGSVHTQYEANGNSQSMYYQPDGTLTASATHMFKPEGGFVDTVMNSQGQVVSVQEVGANPPSSTSSYSPMSQYEASIAVNQEYNSSESTTENYIQNAAPAAVQSTSIVAQNTAAILHRDAYSANDYQSVSSPAPTRNIGTANNNAVAPNQNSNLRSFRTISAILAAATAPASAASRSVEHQQDTNRMADAYVQLLKQ
ncbi:MAG: hypothetical protein HYX67_11440 [Candidatus Melainabacteria bacterium]|nr:hypothetical protein [Candidatus Melainabacteria bacterium]